MSRSPNASQIRALQALGVGVTNSVTITLYASELLWACTENELLLQDKMSNQMALMSNVMLRQLAGQEVEERANPSKRNPSLLPASHAIAGYSYDMAMQEVCFVCVCVCVCVYECMSV